MSKSNTKQLGLGEKPPAKKKKEPPVTDLVHFDFNTWKIPKDWDLVDTALDLLVKLGMDLPNTFHIIKNKIGNDFLITDGTLLWTNKPCPGCSKKHTSSIDVETKEIIQQCSASNAIFKDQKNKNFVQVQLICPTCKKNHLTMDYSSWQTLSDKRCSDCQQKTAAADAAKRKKESRKEKEDENIPQLTPETNSEASDITLRSDEYHCSICGIRKRIDFKFEDGFFTCSCGNPIEKIEEDIYSCPHCTTCYPISLLPTDGRCTRCAKHPLLLDLEGKKITKKKLEELQSPTEGEKELPPSGIDEVAEAIEELEIDPLLKEKYKNMEEWEICQSVKTELESMGMKRYYSAFVKKENKIATNINQVMLLADEYIQKARAKLNEESKTAVQEKDKQNVIAVLKERYSEEESEELQDSKELQELKDEGAFDEQIHEEHKEIIEENDMYFGEFLLLAQDFGSTIKRLSHPLFAYHFYLTVEDNLIGAIQTIHKKEYWGKSELKKPIIIYVMNYQSFNTFSITQNNISTVNEPIPPMQFTQLDESWVKKLFPDFEYPSDYYKLWGIGDPDNPPPPSGKRANLNKRQDLSPHGDKKDEAFQDAKLFEEERNEGVSDESIREFKKELEERKKLARANKKQNKKATLKVDNGTREGIPFAKEEKKKKKETQISLQSFTTMRINVNKLKTTDFQFRSKLNDEHISFLKDSMNQKRNDGSNMGNIEAVLVRTIDDGFYEIISGHHRVAAAKKAKQKSLKCEVLDVDDAAAYEASLIANFARMEMSPIEEARALKAYRDHTELSFERIGKRIGKTKSWISRRLALLNTSDIVQKSLDTGQITPAHVKAVSSLEPKEQDKLLKKVVKEGMTTHTLEFEVRTKKREQDDIEKATEDSKKFGKYIKKNLDGLKDKTISKTSCWSSRNDEELFDMHFHELLSKANLREYKFENAKILKPFYDILKENNIQVVDARRLEAKLTEEKKEAERAKREEAKKKDPCKVCDVKLKIDEEWYCPIADPTKKKPNCEDFYERPGYGFDLPDKLKKLCFICNKEIKKGEPSVSNYQSKSYHSFCYYQLIEQIEGLELKPCPTCKKRGDCGIQGTAKDLVLDHKVTLTLNTCDQYRDETAPDTYLLKFNDDYGVEELYHIDDLINEVESELNDIAEYILEEEIPLKHISAAEDAESQASFDELKNRLLNIQEAKSGKFKYMLSNGGDIGFILTDFDTEEEVDCEREDMLLYFVDEEIPLNKIKAIDEESEKILQELQMESSDS